MWKKHLFVCRHIVVIFLFLFLVSSNANAQITPTPTVPPPVVPGDAKPAPYVPCNETRDSEFHSLRPYQASPCNPYLEGLAAFCGNNLFVGDILTISKTYSGGDEVYKLGDERVYPNPPTDNLSPLLCYFCSSEDPDQCYTRPDPCIPDIPCSDLGCGECVDDGIAEECAFNVSRTKNVTASFVNSEFPIMGYTEPSAGNDTEEYKVINSENTDSENMDHGTKMNEYVSWYLNGVIGRAEYPYLNPELNCVGESTHKVGTCRQTRVEDDGSLTCLGTWGIPFIEPFAQPTLIADGKSVCTGDTRYCCVNKYIPSYSENTPGPGNVVNYSGPLKKLLPFSIQNIERTQEAESGHESNTNDAGTRHDQVVSCDYELVSLTLPVLGDITIGGLPAKCYGNEFFGIPTSWLVRQKRLADYNEHAPPIEDTDEYLGENFNFWLVDYKTWRGNVCASFPIHFSLFGKEFDFVFYLCVDNPFRTNIFGNMFSYIPFSSTEDRLGTISISDDYLSAYSSSPDVKILYSEITSSTPAYTFVPHMEESNELGSLLQKTYSYKDADLTEIISNGYQENASYCDYFYTRTNPGDDLFSGDALATVNFIAEITCDFFNWGNGTLCLQVAHGICYPATDPDRYLYAERSFGQYDCDDGYLCVQGPDELDGAQDKDIACRASAGNVLADCFPENFIFNDLPCSETDVGVVPNVCGDNFACSLEECVRYNEEEPAQYCSQPVMAGLEIDTDTPLLKKVWARLVAGTSGVVRKMFPRPETVENGFPDIIDMPASTNANYSSQNGSVYSGDPSSRTSGTGAQIYFPHLGGIKEYFLSGIQTLLRPKGFGKDIAFSTETPSEPFDCDWLQDELSNVDTSSPCGICNADSYLGPLAQSILTAAGKAYNVPAAAIFATMLNEGGGWDEYVGQYTDDNVCNWSAPIGWEEPGVMPSCDNTVIATQPPFGWIRTWFYLGEGEYSAWNAVEALIPNKDTKPEVNRCNFLDAAFATAKQLNIGASYCPVNLEPSCYCVFDVSNTSRPTSCNWDEQTAAHSFVSYGGICIEDYVLRGIDWFNQFRCY